MLDGTTDAVYVKDLRGRYLMINPAGAAMLEREVAEVLGKDDTELFEPGDAERVQREDREVLDRKSTRLNSSHSGESRMPSSA